MADEWWKNVAWLREAVESSYLDVSKVIEAKALEMATISALHPETKAKLEAGEVMFAASLVENGLHLRVLIAERDVVKAMWEARNRELAEV